MDFGTKTVLDRSYNFYFSSNNPNGNNIFDTPTKQNNQVYEWLKKISLDFTN